MTAESTLAHGDFSTLAENYSKYRPHYSDTVLDEILAILARPEAELDAADIGAGTGIWSRMLAGRELRSVTAVEPNPEMRARGTEDSADLDIRWQAGSGEATGLETGSIDLLTAASCFHWFDFEKATTEIHRVLRASGCFVALWNPRDLDANPQLKEIEDELFRIAPDIKRVSSGSSSFVSSLMERLAAAPEFQSVVGLEGRHVQRFTLPQYLGVWRSVNDVQVQAGPERFARFLEHLERELPRLSAIDVTYRTRAWVARRS